MSSATTPVNTDNFLQVNRSTAMVVMGGNEFESMVYTNGGGTPVTLSEGTLVGKIGATQKIVPLESAATDGSQYPVGVLPESYTVAAGATVNLPVVTAGPIIEGMVVLDGTDTLDTVIEDRSIRDRISSDTLGLKLVKTTELSGYDN